jgi:hypothetical protein
LALGHRLELRQGQGLVITPQLQQAIKLLQLSNLELDAFVEAELERNPLLQRDDGPAETERAPEEIAERPTENLGLDSVSDSAASSQMDATPDDVSPGERATGDGSDQGAEQAGGQIDWSRTGGGGNFEGDGHYEERPGPRPDPDRAPDRATVRGRPVARPDRGGRGADRRRRRHRLPARRPPGGGRAPGLRPGLRRRAC